VTDERVRLRLFLRHLGKHYFVNIGIGVGTGRSGCTWCILYCMSSTGPRTLAGWLILLWGRNGNRKWCVVYVLCTSSCL